MLECSFNSSRDHYYGTIDAPIELIEYGDFQCRRCASVYREINALQDLLGNKLRFVFRHFPLVHLHPLALEAAIASEAAALQHKFWSMHNMIYQNQEELSRTALLELAEDININMDFYESSREHRNIFKKVLFDFDSAVLNGVTSTPTFFINGFLYTGKADFRSLYKICRFLLSFKNEEIG